MDTTEEEHPQISKTEDAVINVLDDLVHATDEIVNEQPDPRIQWIYDGFNLNAKIHKLGKTRKRDDGGVENRFIKKGDLKFPSLAHVNVIDVRCGSVALSHTLEDIFMTAEDEDQPVLANFDIPNCGEWACGLES
ncbi:hypothetical protein R1sor_025623 [Riccia sorocarpa]|uniref:Uncharacterized protein n=1 Tax=Riccia sorocarpa TaxID=122646 RepID=A0ABD3G969_9MARC